MLPTEGGEHFVKKIIKIMKERVCRALNAQKKQQMAWEFDKQTNSIHTILFLQNYIESGQQKSSPLTTAATLPQAFRVLMKSYHGCIGKGWRY